VGVWRVMASRGHPMSFVLAEEGRSAPWGLQQLDGRGCTQLPAPPPGQADASTSQAAGPASRPGKHSPQRGRRTAGTSRPARTSTGGELPTCKMLS